MTPPASTAPAHRAAPRAYPTQEALRPVTRRRCLQNVVQFRVGLHKTRPSPSHNDSIESSPEFQAEQTRASVPPITPSSVGRTHAVRATGEGFILFGIRQQHSGASRYSDLRVYAPQVPHSAPGLRLHRQAPRIRCCPDPGVPSWSRCTRNIVLHPTKGSTSRVLAFSDKYALVRTHRWAKKPYGSLTYRRSTSVESWGEGSSEGAKHFARPCFPLRRRHEVGRRQLVHTVTTATVPHHSGKHRGGTGSSACRRHMRTCVPFTW